jgi:hypothetical protein
MVSNHHPDSEYPLKHARTPTPGQDVQDLQTLRVSSQDPRSGLGQPQRPPRKDFERPTQVDRIPKIKQNNNNHLKYKRRKERENKHSSFGSIALDNKALNLPNMTNRLWHLKPV